MADVTFGVKVSEEMKEELSDLMRNSTLSGKEFMGLLLSSYKLEKKVGNDNLFESDFKELQVLLSRVQNIYRGMIEKSDIEWENKSKVLNEETIVYKNKIEELNNLVGDYKGQLSANEDILKKETSNRIKLEDSIKAKDQEIDELKQQLRNHLLLHTKFEEQLAEYKSKQEDAIVLQEEYKKSKEDNIQLSESINKLREEVKFLQFELNTSKGSQITLKKEYDNQISELKNSYELKLSNELLKEKVKFQEEVMKYKEEINNLMQQNYKNQENYEKKIDTIHKNK